MEGKETYFAKWSREVLPSLFVFDLDYTLWPFWVDTHVHPPFLKDKLGRVLDKFNTAMELYPDVQDIIENVKRMNVKIAAASRTETPEEAREFLKLIGIHHFFDHLEIYPGCKLAHFKKLREKSEVCYDNMIFFDDEQRNINDVRKLGVTCIHVSNGLDIKCVEQGLKQFKARIAGL